MLFFSCSFVKGITLTSTTQVELSEFPGEKIASEDTSLYNTSVSHQYFLCVCAIFKDEAPYFKEWIEYYKMLGVEHFRLYNNDSTDNYLEILEPYIQQGDVTLIDWPSNPAQLGANYEWVWTTQLPALSDAISHFNGVSKWLAVIDLDEYILPFHHSNLISFLEEYEYAAGVVINWHNFGTSNLHDIPSNKLMIETLTLRAHEQSPYNHPVKSILRPDRVDIKTKSWCPHTWAYLSSKDELISPNHKKWRFGKIDVTKARINHYVHKTEKYFYETKVPNKERMEGRIVTEAYISEWKSSCNQIHDTEIFRFVPDLRNRVFEKN